MKKDNFSSKDKDMIRQIKLKNYIALGVLAVLFAAVLAWFCSYKYWHSFSQEKWSAYPERRAKMTSDLLGNYELIGMTEAEIVNLLGQNNNDYGYFVQDSRFVYYLGNERTIIDSEWLLIDFENGIATEYSMTTD